MAQANPQPACRLRLLIFGFSLVLLAGLPGCGGGTAAAPNAVVPRTVTSLAVGPASASINFGATQAFTATASYSDGSTGDVTGSASWSSSDTTKATVETIGETTPGLATAIGAGSATITASLGGQLGTAALTVKSATLTALSVTPTNPTISTSATQQFTATGTYSDQSTSAVTSSATWASSNPNIATIQTSGQTSSGLATAVANGSSNIQATFAGITGLTILNVSTPGGTQTSLGLSEIDPSISISPSEGSTLQFSAVAIYNNGSNQKVTSTATWTSSNPAVATVQNAGGANPGLVTGLSAGTTMIAASSGGFNQSATVTVAANAVPIPLMDMTGSDNYLGFAGGLYGGNSNAVQSGHDSDGQAAAALIQPLDQNGNPSATGAVVFLGIGMSNATLEFSAFKTTAQQSTSVNQTTLAIEDGAYGSVTACEWTVAQGSPTPTPCPGLTGVPAENQYDRVRDTVLATATTAPSAPAGCGTTADPCLTEAQVQILWIKNANPQPAFNALGSMSSSTDCASEVADFTTEACNYESQLGQTIRAARSRYPNLKQIFLSTRIYAGYATVPLNPEPYAYEYGYSAQWLIQAQVNQMNTTVIDPVAGDLSYTDGSAAWTAWSGYLWADGDNPRSDGLIWCGGQPSAPCNGEDDYQSDGTHPNTTFGVPKVVNLLMNFFTTSVYTSWFRP